MMRILLILATIFLLAGLSQADVACDACSATLYLVENLINGTSIGSIAQNLDKVCHHIAKKNSSTYNDCMKIADKLSAVIKSFPAFLQKSVYSPKVICGLINICKLKCCVSDNVPEQVMLGFGEEKNTVRVRWITFQNSNSVVNWVTANVLVNSAHGTSYTYTAGGWDGHIHEALLSNISAGVDYFYKVGDGSTWSKVFSFTAPSTTYPQKIAFVGDMGAEPSSTSSIQRLGQMIQAKEADFVFHVGDISYADGNQNIWDNYGRQISPGFASNGLYSLIPGNHEIAFDFASFRHRFTNGTLYGSRDVGRIHFIGINSESVVDTPEITDVQLAWITQDLAGAAARKKAGEIDWIVVSLHRPLYCTSSKVQCGELSQYLRSRVEDIFNKYGVNLVFQAHRHNYERTTPVYNSTITPGAPVYIVNGIAGCREGNNGGFNPNGPDWRVVYVERSSGTENSYAVGLLTALNSTHLHWKIMGDDTGALLDECYVTQ